MPGTVAICSQYNARILSPFSKAYRTFNKKLGAGQREATEKKEDKMIWAEGNHP
jgi:hypothetical protein